MKSRLKTRIIRNISFSLAGSVVERGLNFLAFVFAARFMGTIGFGELGIIYSTMAMISVFAGFGIVVTGTKYVAQFKIVNPEKTGRIIGLIGIVSISFSTIYCCVIINTAGTIATDYLHAFHLKDALLVSGILLAFNIINEAQKGILTGLEEFKKIIILNFISGISTLVLMTTGVYYGNLIGALYGASFASFITLVFSLYFLTKACNKYLIPVSVMNSFKELKIISNYSFPAFISGVSVAMGLWLMRTLILGNPNGYYEIGLFTAASRFQVIVNLLGISAGNALLPILSTQELKKNKALIDFNIIVSWGIGIFLTIPIICFPEIAVVIFGENFDNSQFYKIVALLMVTAVIMLYKQGLGRIIAANGLMWWSALSNILWVIILLMCTQLFIEQGAFGLSKALFCSYLVNVFFVIPFLIKKKLVQKKLLFSINIVKILGTVYGSWLLGSLNIPVSYRIIIFPLIFIILIYQFKIIVNESKAKNLFIL
jgi:O-antigen/teichoic acid export membrane protein